MATRRPYWKWPCWKSIGFCLWPKQTWLTSRKPCHLQSPETEKSNMAARRPFWNWRCWKSIGSYPYTKVLCRWSLKLIFNTKVKLESGNKKSNMAARRSFWKWHRWKSIGFCLWPPSTCIWNLKLKFQSKLDLCSGKHVVYRQTDGQTDGRTDGQMDKVNPVYPPSNFVGRGYKYTYISYQLFILKWCR